MKVSVHNHVPDAANVEAQKMMMHYNLLLNVIPLIVIILTLQIAEHMLFCITNYFMHYIIIQY